jgi:acetyl-CoA carboxylase biotin carboxyl carrier protein
MVGTYYAAANVDSEPYVALGSEVNVGDTLCVIEAMKIFNQVETEISGFVRKILKRSGDPVEYGETLFLIESNNP